MKKRVVIALAVAGILTSAVVGYSAFGQSGPTVPDCATATEPGTPERTQCEASQNQGATATGSNTTATTGTGVTYRNINDWSVVPSGEANDRTTIWIQNCGPCQLNIYEQMRDSPDAASALQGAADESRGVNGSPQPQCQNIGECITPLSQGGPTCADDCTGCDGNLTPEQYNYPPECWELASLTYPGADGCVPKPGCAENPDDRDPYPVVEIRQPYLWVWTGGCGDGTYGGFTQDLGGTRRIRRALANEGSGPNPSTAETTSQDGQASWLRNTGYEDLFPSFTGCYSPEERFMKVVGQEDNGNGAYILAPDDARLTLHPRCIAGSSALRTNQPIPWDGSELQGQTGSTSKSEVYTSVQDFGSFKPAHVIGCLHNDYIDDFSNFCRQYIMHEKRYLADKWKMAEGCWTLVENQPGLAAPVAGEHYLPLALYYQGETSFEAVPDGQSYTARYGNMGQHGFGRYRIYDPRSNPSGVFSPEENLSDPDGRPVMEIAADGERAQEAGIWINKRNLDPLDVYNYGESYAAGLVMDENYVGRKFKLQACVKQYIEEYAHLGDCGQIVLPGAKPHVSDSHCQWVTMARQDKNRTYLQTLWDAPLVQPALEEILGVTLETIGEMASQITGNPVTQTRPEFTVSKRGMRAEYFDYQNFATAGWVPSTPPFLGIPPEMSTDICTKKVTDGTLNQRREQQVFNTAKGLDFARRGCPTVIGPDTWPMFFNMRTCDYNRGALQFSEGIECDAVNPLLGTCISFNPLSYFQFQTFPPQAHPRNLTLSANIDSPLAYVWWMGIRGGIASVISSAGSGNWGSAVSGVADAALNMKPMLMNSVPVGLTGLELPIIPPQDYVDPLYVARDCTHAMQLKVATAPAVPQKYWTMADPPYIDYWYETADWMPAFLPEMVAAGVPTCRPFGTAASGQVCCGDECGVAGINCDCWPSDAINPRPTGGGCGAGGTFNRYTWDINVGQNYRTGACADRFMPSETVFGFVFYGGEVPEEFREFQWPDTMDIVNGIVENMGVLQNLNLTQFLQDLGMSPEAIQTINDIGDTLKTASEWAEDIQDAREIAGTVAAVAPLANMGAMMLLGVQIPPEIMEATTKGVTVSAAVWDDFYAKAKPVFDMANMGVALLNASGLGSFDIGCVADYWVNEYGGDGLQHLEEYVTGRTEEEQAQQNPNYQMPPYGDGQGPNKVLPASCLKTENNRNFPVVFSYHPNLMRFQDAQWCEFEVPYLPHTYDYSFSLDDLVVLPGPGYEAPPNPEISYTEAAYNAAVASVAGITAFLVQELDDQAINEVRNQDYDSEGFKWFGMLRSIYDPMPPAGVAEAGGAGYDVEDEPGFPMVERIRDGCGAFTQRASWTHDRNNQLYTWLTAKTGGRCEGWKGIYGRKHKDIKVVSWRLPRFNYEFLKAFIECTGPVYSRGPNVCASGIDWLTISLNAMPCVDTGGVSCIRIPPPTGPIPIPGNLRPTNFDDKTEYSEPWNAMDRGRKFGFWCSCPRDNMLTTICNESFCTCDAVNINQVPWPPGIPGTRCDPDRMSGGSAGCGKIAALSINMCEGYGPFAQWLQCYYNARAKACPVLEREISNGIVGSMHMQTNPNQMVSTTGSFQAMAKQPAEKVNPKDICRGIEPKTSYENLRWNAEEPNILAHLPITADYAARDQTPFYNEGKPAYIQHDIGFMKHRDLVFQSAVRDIGAPYLEITLPWPTSLDVPAQSMSLDNSAFLDPSMKAKDLELFMKAHDAANLAWLETRASDIGGLDEAGQTHNDWPHPRATEVILGPRGCDIGGWYEMMLYQARCIRWFKLNCICDYRKTFVQGSSEAYVLMRGGIGFPTRLAYLDYGDLKITQNRMTWPLMWRGFAGPDYAPPPRYVADPEAAAYTQQQLLTLWPSQLKDGVSAGSIIDTSQLDPVLARKVAEWERDNAGKLWIQPNSVRVCSATEDPAVDDCVRLCQAGQTPAVDGCVYTIEPYTVAYGGLEYAKPGDFMMYDEQIPYATGPLAGEDARYPRHIAYIENVDIEKGIVTVSEMNWGKDLDSCGNTDRWGIVTTRRIYRDANDINTELLCNNPDWLDCYEPNWYYIKVYRPSLDVNNQDRPVCFSEFDKKLPYEGQVMGGEYALQMPEKFAPESRSMYVQFNSKGRVVVNRNTCPNGNEMPIAGCGGPLPVPLVRDNTMGPEDILYNGVWKREYYGWYDANEVAAFLKQRRGRCDPPVPGADPDYTVPAVTPGTVPPELLDMEF